MGFASADDLEEYIGAQVEGLPSAVAQFPRDERLEIGPLTAMKSVHWLDRGRISALVAAWSFPDGRHMIAEEIVGKNPGYYCFRFEMAERGGVFGQEVARRKRLIEVKYGTM